MLGFFYSYHLPAFKLWAIERIATLSQEKTPVKVMMSNIDFNLFPIGISFQNLRLTPQKELSSVLDDAFIKELRFSLNPFSFFTGLFQFSKIEIVEPNITIKDIAAIQKLGSPEKEKSHFSLQSILRVPLNSFVIHRMSLTIPAQERIPEIKLRNFSLEIENQKASALISFIIPQLTVYDSKIADIPADVSVGSRILVQDDQILISALKIKKGSSYILLGGYTQTPLSDIKFDKVNLKVKTHFQLNQLQKEILPFLKNATLPNLKGTIDAQTIIKKQPQETLEAETKFSLHDVQIDQYTVGQASGHVTYKNDVLQSPLLQIQNSMGKLQIQNIQLQLKDHYDYKADLSMDHIQLQEVLRNIGLGEVGVKLEASTQMPCSGQIKGSSFLKCAGSLAIENLRVYNADKDIVNAKNGIVKGAIEVTSKQVNLDGDISLGQKSAGHASGYVHYEKGFRFDYAAPILDLQDVEIANLELQGTASNLKGSTQGDSNKAIFDISTEFGEFFIKKYYAGRFSTHIFYKSETLKISQIKGFLKSSKYLGDLSVHFNNNTIDGNFKSGYLELTDLQKAFALIAPLPFEAYGSGTAEATFSGPLEFNHLSYNLQSRFLNGNIAGEPFDEAVFNVTSTKGHVVADKAFLNKSGGHLALSGTAEPSGKIKTKWQGTNFSLHSLNSITKSGIDIDGELNFEFYLTEDILSPKSLLKAKISKTKIAQEKVNDSQFTVSFGKNTIEGSGELLGKKIVGNFIIPLSDEAPFYIQANIDKWDFVPLLYLITSKSRAQEFSTSLSSKIELRSSSNGFWKSNGHILINELSIQRGIKQLSLHNPSEIIFTSGQAKMDRAEFIGDNTSLEISNSRGASAPISLTLNGKVDIGLLSFLTPFLDDLQGGLAITTKVELDQNNWSIGGSGFLNQGIIRTDALPHSFENIQADLLFNDKKILVNKISSDFAGGKLNGSGIIEVNGTDKLKTDISGQFQNLTLQIPKGFLSKGSGDFHLFGNWFPYTLQGTYFIQSGLVSKQFDDEGGSQSKFARQQLLPGSLTKKNSELLLVDIDLIFNHGVDIKNDIIESKAYGRLQMKGPVAQPIFLGQVQLQRNGKIFFNDTEFEIDTGDLKFNDPNKINPEIYLTANTTAESVSSNRIQHYDVNMLIQGKADKYSINLTSSPPLDEKEIISLLALGMSGESTFTGNNQNQFGESQITKQSYGVGASLLTKNKFGRDLQNKTGVQVKVSTSYDQVTNSTSPKITLSKQWTPKIQTSTSRTFGDLTTQDVKVEYQFNRNLSLIGSWVGQETSTANQTNQSTTNINDKTKTSDFLGLDLEYKFEFK